MKQVKQAARVAVGAASQDDRVAGPGLSLNEKTGNVIG